MFQTVPFLNIQGPCQSVVDQAVGILQQEDLQVIRSFDLQEALASHPDCTCPRHGFARCSCQLVVLLVYEKTGDYLTLIADGQDHETSLSFVIQNLPSNDARLEMKIRQRLTNALLA